MKLFFRFFVLYISIGFIIVTHAAASSHIELCDRGPEKMKYEIVERVLKFMEVRFC